MCRLVGAFSSDRLSGAFHLLEAPRSLFVQSDLDKKRKQGDGWGVGWFKSQRPVVFKSPRPMYNDRPHVRQAAKRAEGNVVLGHVRWASNPLKLPRRELIGLPHTQPFRHGSWLFVHNGTLYIPREVSVMLGSWAKFIQGHNDSEVLFYWLLKTVIQRKSGSWDSRLRQSIRGLHEIWEGCKARYPLHRFPYHGLNWVLTNGRIFLAFCYADPSGLGKSKALGNRKQPYYELQLQSTRSMITVASEPLTADTNWRSLGHGRLLVAEKRGRSLKSQILKVF